MPAWLIALDRLWPVRYLTLALCLGAGAAGLLAWLGPNAEAPTPSTTALGLAGGLLSLLGLHDLLQRRHALLRNYPVLGHVRFLLEWIRPEIRQYFIDSDRDAVPFSRQQRSLVYQRAKGEADQRAFGTQQDVQAPGHQWLNHSLAPSRLATHDLRVRIGGAHCAEPYSASLFNISAMSFGALSAQAILALNAGAKRGGFAHDTGEGSISPHHRVHGGDLIWEIGSGYFGCRDAAGRFDPVRFAVQAREPQVKMVELKLSQGAKPGHGGVLPAAKVTAEIAATRGVPEGQDCISPAAHSAFGTPVEMLLFLQQLRELSGGKPVGFKLCIGHPWEWFAIAKAMRETRLLPDFIVVDGAEGGTGAAPAEFADHVGMPLQEGLRLVHDTLVGLNLREAVRIGCAGKVVSAFDIARLLALGADWCNAARGFMFALGCIQAQQCHTGACPTGVATQDPLRQRALAVDDKAERVWRFHQQTLHALKELLQAAGVDSPAALGPQHLMQRGADGQVAPLAPLSPERAGAAVAPGALLAAERGDAPWPAPLYAQHWPLASAYSFAAVRAPWPAAACPPAASQPAACQTTAGRGQPAKAAAAAATTAGAAATPAASVMP